MPARTCLEQAETTRKTASTLVRNGSVRTFWSSDAKSLLYRLDSPDGTWQFFCLDLTTGQKAPAFDHAALADALRKNTNNKKSDSSQLPLDWLDWSAESQTIWLMADGKSWSFHLPDATLRSSDKAGLSTQLVAPQDLPRARHTGETRTSATVENATAVPIEMFWINGRETVSYGKIDPGQSRKLDTHSGHAWLARNEKGEDLAAFRAQTDPIVAHITGKIAPKPAGPDPAISPDAQWRAEIREGNVVLVPTHGDKNIPLTHDADEKSFYEPPFAWSPDGKKLVAHRSHTVQIRKVHIVRSSPKDRMEPKLITLDYPKPGDPLPQPKPCLFDVTQHRTIPVPDALFSNPWEITDLAWSPDGKEFSFVYNQRGHQIMRILAVNAATGSVRTIHEETSPTFIDYSQKFFVHRFSNPAGSFLWATESSGYNHLIRIDGSGRVANPVTQGQWNVREVVKVEEKAERVLLKINGQPGTDPYYEHFAWASLDGSHLTRLTQGDGNHQIRFSPDRKFFLDTWSRVDLPPVTEVRRADDGTLVAEIIRGEDSALQATGWSRPERFCAKGRDGKTDIFGIIVRPTQFDPTRRYPVLEDIYAGPQDFFVPKSYETWTNLQTMAELGFIVVQIDGMGTNWRSKAFHNVCWKNLADGGFPDRIAWLKAAAASRPWMNLERMGIFGGSAGGQNALAALLHHGNFYKAAVADCGCHDNRMDKVWWNEAWMGWPIDESYARNSNVTHAANLKGQLLLVVGEVDDNVDPASSAQVVAALQNAGKMHEFLPIMNAGHGAAETPYGRLRRAEFFMRHLQTPE